MRAGAKIVELPSAGTAGNAGTGPGQAGLSGSKRSQGERPLRPSQCRAFMRRTLAREFPGIVDGFVKQAKRGSCQHVKLASELLEAQVKRPTAPRGSRTLSRLVAKIQQLED